MPERFSEFQDVVTSVDELRAVIREPMSAIRYKVIDHLDDVCRRFIQASPFAILASRSSQGWMDVSPRGDPPGFVRVLDEHHLAIPDRPGNRRLDTFQNLLDNPQIGIIFLIPGRGETLRVSGEARVVRDLELRESMAMQGKTPAFAIVVYVKRAFIHCPKCVMRSHLWEPEAANKKRDVPDINEAMIQHAQLTDSPEEWLAKVKQDGGLEMY